MKDVHEMPLDELVEILSRGRLGEESPVQETLGASTEIRDALGKPLPRTIVGFITLTYYHANSPIAIPILSPFFLRRIV